MSDLEDQHPAKREQRGGLRRNRAVGIKAVRAPIEGKMRIVVAHITIEYGNVRRPDVGRVRHDEIEWPVQRRRIVALDERSPVRKAELLGVDFSSVERLPADVGADARGGGEFGEQRQQDGAGPGADVSDAKLAVFGKIVPDDLKRSGNNGFGIGTRHQCRVGQAQVEAPEFLVAQNAGDRLMHQAALRKGGDDAGLILSHLAVRLDRKAGVIEAERRADQKARIEVRRIDIAGFEFCRQCAPRRLNGQSGERSAGAHDAPPCSASNLA